MWGYGQTTYDYVPHLVQGYGRIVFFRPLFTDIELFNLMLLALIHDVLG